MPAHPSNHHTRGRAEAAFREAFERLKRGMPTRLSKRFRVSQNNVAKEAGVDPSALKKARFPELIAEIQRWIGEHGPNLEPSRRQSLLSNRRRSRSLREKIEDLRAQRDHAASLLVEADARILDLTLENSRLLALLPINNVTPIRSVKEPV